MARFGFRNKFEDIKNQAKLIKDSPKLVTEITNNMNQLDTIFKELKEVINQSLINDMYLFRIIKRICKKMEIEIPEEIERHFLIENE